VGRSLPDTARPRTNSNAARYEAGGVAEVMGGFLKRPIAAYVQSVVFRVFMERLIKAVNLLAIASLKPIKHMMDKVMNLNDGLITEPGQDYLGIGTLPAKAGVGI